jgi:asparagine N-glycosylation enzyme membrane subunit Stt3
MKKFSIKALAYACHAVIWFVVVITIAAETAVPVKNFLTGLTGHHWTAKGLISLLIFFMVAFVFANKEDPEDVTGLVRGVLISAVLGTAVIFIFYLKGVG